MGEKLRESMVYPLTTGWWRDSLSKHDQCAQHLTAVSGDFTSVRRLFAFLRVKIDSMTMSAPWTRVNFGGA